MQGDLSRRSADLTDRQANADEQSHRVNPKRSGAAELTRQRIRQPPDVAERRDRVIPKRSDV
jgi:hypothetical protein